MLKFIQSKTFKIGGFVVAFAFAFALMASAATYVPVKKGSDATAVMAVQTLVGATADGKYGPMTAAKVMAWQAANGLTADGKFGPMSAAKANGGSTTTTTSTVAGCAPGAMFSATTGMPCTTTTTTTTTTTGMTGGAGSATVTELSTPTSNTKIGEGDTNAKVLGIEVEADNNSDLSVTSMKVSFVNGGSGSSKLNRYAKTVSIWYNDAKVGSASTDDFSETSGTYSKSISIANAIVKADKVGKFYVAVDAISDIDSGNTGSSNNTWTVTLNSTRYMDATGAVLTDSTGSIANTAIFDTLSSTNDVEAKVNLASDSVTSKTIKVSTTNDTNQVELMKFTIKAQGSKMVVDQIPVLFTATGTAASDLDQMTSNVTLKIDGQTFNESVVTSATATATISFDDLNIEVSAESTVTGTIYADLNDIDTGFAEGDTLTAAITSSLVTTTGSSAGALDIEDSNGDQVATGDRSGSATGNVLTFRSTGVNAVMGTPSYSRTTDTNGKITSVTYTVPVAVTAFGNTLYMGQSAQFATTATASNAFAITFENAAAPTTALTSSSTQSITLSSSNATIETNGFRLDDGTTKNFTITVNLTDPNAYDASFRVRLAQARTFTEAWLSTGTNSTLLPQTDYRTGFELINN